MPLTTSPFCPAPVLRDKLPRPTWQHPRGEQRVRSRCRAHKSASQSRRRLHSCVAVSVPQTLFTVHLLCWIAREPHSPGVSSQRSTVQNGYGAESICCWLGRHRRHRPKDPSGTAHVCPCGRLLPRAGSRPVVLLHLCRSRASSVDCRRHMPALGPWTCPSVCQRCRTATCRTPTRLVRADQPSATLLKNVLSSPRTALWRALRRLCSLASYAQHLIPVRSSRSTT